MAVTPQSISSAIKASTPNLNGVDWVNACQALGFGIHKEIVNPSTVTLNGITFGVAGAGTIPTGKMSFAPVPNMQKLLAANNVKGVIATQIAVGCITGVTTALNASCEYYGSSTGVGVGTDNSKVVFANPLAIAQSIQGCLVAFGLKGIVAQNTARGIGYGISSILLSGVGVAGVVGSASPFPSSGFSVCFLR